MGIETCQWCSCGVEGRFGRDIIPRIDFVGGGEWVISVMGGVDMVEKLMNTSS